MNCIRPTAAKAPKAKYTAQELELAKSLIDQLTAPFKPNEFEDGYRENVERLIEQKRKGQKITTVRQPAKAPVIDLMEALSGTAQGCLTPANASVHRLQEREFSTEVFSRRHAAPGRCHSI
jgi:DNA end-binding protein Ku